MDEFRLIGVPAGIFRRFDSRLGRSPQWGACGVQNAGAFCEFRAEFHLPTSFRNKKAGFPNGKEAGFSYSEIGRGEKI